jgi:hypothetical protein
VFHGKKWQADWGQGLDGGAGGRGRGGAGRREQRAAEITARARAAAWERALQACRTRELQVQVRAAESLLRVRRAQVREQVWVLSPEEVLRGCRLLLRKLSARARRAAALRVLVQAARAAEWLRARREWARARA